MPWDILFGPAAVDGHQVLMAVLPLPVTLGILGASFLGGLFGGKKKKETLSPQTRTELEAALRRLVDLQTAQANLLQRRVAFQDPLFQALTQMAFRGLPIFARAGVPDLDPGILRPSPRPVVPSRVVARTPPVEWPPLL